MCSHIKTLSCSVPGLHSMHSRIHPREAADHNVYTIANINSEPVEKTVSDALGLYKQNLKFSVPKIASRI